MTQFEVGRRYRTRGGWEALIIYRLSTGAVIAVHNYDGTEVVEEHMPSGHFSDPVLPKTWDLMIDQPLEKDV